MCAVINAVHWHLEVVRANPVALMVILEPGEVCVAVCDLADGCALDRHATSRFHGALQVGRAVEVRGQRPAIPLRNQQIGRVVGRCSACRIAAAHK